MVEKLMDEAFRLYEEAEMKVDSEPSKSIILFRQAVSNLLNAYLIIKGLGEEGDLAELFRECREIDSEFEIIQSEIEYLVDVAPQEVEGEELTDKANEIWDFIQGVLMENEFEMDNN